jgi:excisionase family DNA binding protein
VHEPVINAAVDQRFLTIGEAAALLRVDEKTIRTWIDTRRLRVRRFSSRIIRIDVADLDALGGA